MDPFHRSIHDQFMDPFHRSIHDEFMDPIHGSIKFMDHYMAVHNGLRRHSCSKLIYFLKTIHSTQAGG
jgi:hypothetical protein